MSLHDLTISPDDPPAPAGPLAREALALGAFDHVVSRLAGFRPREGQREMAAHIAATLAPVDWPPKPEKGAEPDLASGPRAIAVVQAGTGVGKSAAYAATVIPLALAQQKRVIISTATVALQEQLIAKDLPALAAVLPQPFAFALAKGRGRYVCRLKLDQLAGGDANTADLFGDAEPEDKKPAGDALERAWAEQARLYTQWGQMLDQGLNNGGWDGDRDRLTEPPSGDQWAPVAAERHTCTARHCPSYNGCSYYQARARLAQAQVIVVNHDLLLSTLGLHALPDPSDCYVVFDEAHHLGAVAQGQFTESMDLMRGGWLDKLPRAVSDVAGAIAHTPGADVATLARELKAAQADLARVAMARLSESPDWLALTGKQAGMRPRSGAPGYEFTVPNATERFEGGEIPAAWLETVGQIASRAAALLKVFEAIATQLKANARDNPGDAPRCAQLYSRIGHFAPRLQHMAATSDLWLQQPAAGQAPLAKWLEAGIQNGLVTLTAHACPLQPGSLLRSHLWSRVRAAVATSASLVTCGGFDHFLHESGLAYDDAVAVREVQSPFDHAGQGRLVVVQTHSDPKDVEAYTREMLDLLLADLAQVRRGALVLFTSKAQMKRAQDLLERGQHRELRGQVLVQGESSRTQLLQRHAGRVAEGQPSILFGLQSFGEGLDLPGELCEWVFITKLPFASPSDPVGQARADWLKAQGRDPFSELVVPATGARLLQWTGRALRTETDEAVVVCYDARLLRQSYGRRMLKGLPPYRLQRRDADGLLSEVAR